MKMENNMYDLLVKALPAGLKILRKKEYAGKYKLIFSYQGIVADAELSKTCAPNCENDVIKNCIKTAMSTIMIKCGRYEDARDWLNGIERW